MSTINRIMHPNDTATSSEHKANIVPLPLWIIPIRLTQAILAFILLIFIAVPTAIWGGFAAFGFSLFTCIATIIIITYCVLSHNYYPKFYNHWAILGLDIFGVIFWLISFSLLASWAADAFNGDYWGLAYVDLAADISLLRIDGLPMKYKASRALAAVAAAGGAVEFVLFIVTLVFFSLNLHRHRMDGFHSTYGTPQTVRNGEEMKTMGANGTAAPVRAEPLSTTL